MQGLKATLLALLAASALAVSGCSRENPPSTTAQGPPDSAPPPVPTPTDNTGTPAAGPPAAPGAVTPAGATNPNGLTLSDQNFLATAAAAGLLEVAAARAAAQQASDGNVKAFAGTLLKDHTAANADLRALAAKKNLELPAEIGAGQKPTLEALTNTTGAEFDRMFVQTIGISEHQSNVTLFEQAAREAADPDVRAFASKTLPKLREHLDMARKLPGAGAAPPAGKAR